MRGPGVARALVALLVAVPLLVGAAERVFRDCSGCPEMMEVPAGTFVMGSPKEEPGHGAGGYDETPHEVTLSRPFYLAKHEVKVGRFRRFVEATKHVTDGDRSGGGHAHDEKAVWKHRPGTNWRKPGYAGKFELKDS